MNTDKRKEALKHVINAVTDTLYDSQDYDALITMATEQGATIEQARQLAMSQVVQELLEEVAT